MSKKIETKVIEQIMDGKVKMKPRWMFIVGSVATAIGVLLSTSLALLSIQLIRFRLTHPGIGATTKINLVLSSLPWYIPLLAIGSLVGGYYFLKKYDFSYRKNSSYILLLIIMSLFFSTYILDRIGLNNFMMKRGYFKRIYNIENKISPSVRPIPENPGRRHQNRLNQTF